VRTHTVVSQALDALTHLNHRGAASADPLTGDGVGVLTQIPHLFFRRKLEARGIAVARDTDVAVGMLFLPGKGAGVHPDTAARMVDVVEATAREAGLDVLLWRRVPVGEYALGADAKATLPDIRQVILRRPARLQQAAAPGAPAGADYTPESDAAFERLSGALENFQKTRFWSQRFSWLDNVPMGADIATENLFVVWGGLFASFGVRVELLKGVVVVGPAAAALEGANLTIGVAGKDVTIQVKGGWASVI